MDHKCSKNAHNVRYTFSTFQFVLNIHLRSITNAQKIKVVINAQKIITEKAVQSYVISNLIKTIVFFGIIFQAGCIPSEIPHTTSTTIRAPKPDVAGIVRKADSIRVRKSLGPLEMPVSRIPDTDTSFLRRSDLFFSQGTRKKKVALAAMFM